MKKFLCWLVTVCILLCLLFYKEEIVTYILVNVIYPREFIVEGKNDYALENSYKYVQLTEDFSPKNRQDLLNIFYTILNNGWDKFSFVCDLSYKDCTSDVQAILDSPTILSDINNFVHPYNTYNEMHINMNNFGRIDVTVDKVYSDFDIALIEAKKDEIENNVLNDSMSLLEKIKAIHDYIIDTTVYDSNASFDSTSKSNTASGALINHTAICGGYTDAMALFLYDFGVLNYRVSSSEHIWNLLYINGQWKHLDLTWDDPVTNTGENMLLSKFFLISTSELENLNVADHAFDKSVFIEAN